MASSKNVLVLVFLSLFLLLPSTRGFIIMAEMDVHLVTLDWPPFIGPTLENNGFLAEIVREAFSRVGYRVHMDFLPWNRALHMTERGDYDGLIAVYHTEEREEIFHYHSTPLGYAEIVFMELSGREIHYSTMEDIEEYRIGLTRGFVYPAVLEEADFLERVKAEDTKTLLKLLLGRRVDLIVESREVLCYLLEHSFEEDMRKEVQVLEPILERRPLYIAFSALPIDVSHLLTSFNKGLLEIKEDGTYEAIMTQHGF